MTRDERFRNMADEANEALKKLRAKRG